MRSGRLLIGVLGEGTGELLVPFPRVRGYPDGSSGFGVGTGPPTGGTRFGVIEHSRQPVVPLTARGAG